MINGRLDDVVREVMGFTQNRYDIRRGSGFIRIIFDQVNNLCLEVKDNAVIYRPRGQWLVGRNDLAKQALNKAKLTFSEQGGEFQIESPLTAQQIADLITAVNPSPAR